MPLWKSAPDRSRYRHRRSGGLGDDTLSGSLGIDWVDYSDILLGGVTIDLAKGAQKTGSAGIDTLLSIEVYRRPSVIETFRNIAAGRTDRDRLPVAARRQC